MSSVNWSPLRNPITRRVRRIVRRLLPSPGLPDDLVVEVRRRESIPEDELAATVAWLAEGFRWRMRYADFDWYLTAHAGGRLVGNVGVLRRIVTAGDRELIIAMVGGVFTDPAYRGRGIAASLLARADELIRAEGDLTHALLMCGDHLVSMYGRHGWEVVAGPTRFEQPDGPHEATSRIMVKRYGDAPWPPGPIDLRGLPA